MRITSTHYKPGAGFARQPKKGTALVFRRDLVFVVDLAKDPVRQGSLARSTTVIPEHLAA